MAEWRWRLTVDQVPYVVNNGGSIPSACTYKTEKEIKMIPVWFGIVMLICLVVIFFIGVVLLVSGSHVSPNLATLMILGPIFLFGILVIPTYFYTTKNYLLSSKIYHKFDDKVVIVLEGENISTRDAYVYNNIDKTSKLEIRKLRNGFGFVNKNKYYFGDEKYLINVEVEAE